MTDYSDLIDKGCVALNLRRAARVVTRRYQEALRPLKLTSFQFSALIALSRAPSMTQSQLADAFGMDLSTVNRNLKPLHSKDYIEIRPDEDDRRIRHVSITPIGSALLKEGLPLWASVQKDLLNSLGEDNWSEIRGALHRLSD